MKVFLTPLTLVLSLLETATVSAHNHRRLAPQTSIIKALNDDLASGISHPRFTLTAHRGDNLFASDPFEIDVVLSNPSVDNSTSFSTEEGGRPALVAFESKFFVAANDRSSDSNPNFAILNVNQAEGTVSGLVQKDGKLMSLIQRDGNVAVVSEVNFVPPRDWTCGTVDGHGPEFHLEEREEVNVETFEDGRPSRRHRVLQGHHGHEHQEHQHHKEHEPHHHSHHHGHGIQLALDSSQSIYSGINLDRETVLNRRRLTYPTDDFPNAYSYQVDLYIEVDTQMVQFHDPNDTENMPNTIAYVNALVTAASSIYEREIDTHLHVLHIAHTTLYDSIEDSGVALDTMKTEYRNSDTWHFTDENGNTPDLHHLLSYHSLNGGMANVGSICSPYYGFGVSGGVDGDMDDLSTGRMFWDIIVFAHEVGHNFGSGHTHDVNSYSPVIDSCGSGSCNSVSTGEGTIMSYCHTCSGGSSNIGMTFGGSWDGEDARSDLNNWLNNDNAVPFGVEPKRVSHHMYNFVSSLGSCVEPYLPVPSQHCSTDDECNDNNSCTTNTCSSLSGLCETFITINCCGNGYCESGENGSTCPDDCGPYDLQPDTDCSVACWAGYGAAFDIEAISGIGISHITFRTASGSNSYDIYTTTGPYLSSVATDFSGWTKVASGSYSGSTWDYVDVVLDTIVSISAGSVQAFYVQTTANLYLPASTGDDILSSDENVKFLNPTQLYYGTTPFTSPSGSGKSWVGKITYFIEGEGSATNNPTKAPITSTPTTMTPTATPTTASPTTTAQCGNNACELGENTNTCPNDCGPFTLDADFCSSCYYGYSASFDLEAIHDVFVSGLTFRTRGTVQTYDIYTAPGPFVDVERDLSAWTKVGSGSYTGSKWDYVNVVLDTAVSITAGSIQAFYFHATDEFFMSDDVGSDPLSSDGNVKFRNPTQLYYGTSPFTSPSGSAKSWTGSVTYYMDGGSPTTAAPTSAAPTSAAPTSAAPTSAAPTSAAPTSAAPTSATPTSASPTSATPTSAAPTSAAPTSAAPTSAAPTTAAPTSAAPTSAPTSSAPTSATPTSSAPTSASPTTAAPTRSNPVTYAPTSSPITSPTTQAPTSASPVASSSQCYPRATSVKIQSTTTLTIAVFEVKVISASSQANVALTGTASQSSTYKDKFFASRAIDNDVSTFSHTSNDGSPWWQVDFPSAEIQSIEIENRWCGDASDAKACLCRLSDARVVIMKDQVVIAEQSVGDTCNKLNLNWSLDANFACDGTPSPTPSAAVTYPKVSKIRLQSITGQQLHMFEFQVFSSGINIALGKAATQSSTLRSFAAARAVDGDSNTFMHTNDNHAWWEIDLAGSHSIESLTIKNRWCRDSSDVPACLCRLSHSVISLFDGSHFVGAVNTGDTCGKHDVVFDFGDLSGAPSQCTIWN